MAGSVAPYWFDPCTIPHCVFTDSTGAEYRLDGNVAGIWITREGLYVEYDAANKKLFFPFGGSLRWSHRQFTYAGSRTLREVQYGYLRPSPGAAELTCLLVRHDSGDASRSFHARTRVDDSTSHSTEWTFQTAFTPVLSVGLAPPLKIHPSAAANPLRQHGYTWTPGNSSSLVRDGQPHPGH